MDIKFRKHARERMVMRGISVEEIKEAIRIGSKRKDRKGNIISAFRYFEVVFKKRGNQLFVITVILRW